MAITKEMLISDALRQGDIDEMAGVLTQFGMHCIGCALSRGETLEQAAAVHGIDVNEMIAALNAIAKK